MVNFSKSEFQTTKCVGSHTIVKIKDVLRIKHVGKLGSYLGCPIVYGNDGKNQFNEIVDLTKFKKMERNYVSKI